MPRLTSAQSSALADWWNLAYDAAVLRLGSSVLLEAAAGIASDAGRSLAFTESTAIVQLYAYASRMVGAANEVQSALASAVIGPEHIATPPWARDEVSQLTVPIKHVIFQFDYIDADGVARTDYRTSVFEMTFPGTIGDLAAAITEDAQALASKYNVTLVNATLHQILAV
jgi:hypothetical protein